MRAWTIVDKRMFQKPFTTRWEEGMPSAHAENYIERLRAIHEAPQLVHKKFCQVERHLINQVQEHLERIRGPFSGGVATYPLAASLVALKYFWVRPVEEFVLPWWCRFSFQSEMELQAALVRHLLMVYEIPRFFSWRIPVLIVSNDQGSLDRTFLVMAIAIGQGQSFRKIPCLCHPEIPSSFQQELFALPKDGLGYQEAFLRALTFSLGGSERESEMLGEINYILNPYCHKDFTQERFSRFLFATARWVIRNKETLDDDKWQTILPWAQHQMVESLRDKQTFSWKGRTVRSAYRAALAYRQEREALEDGLMDCKPWTPQGWNWQCFMPGLGQCSLVELTTPEALQEEGDEMDHCVKSYGPRCFYGDSAIFSLRVEGERRLTIEVKLRDRRIAQVLGMSNRLPTETEQSVVDLWYRSVVMQSDGET